MKIQIPTSTAEKLSLRNPKSCNRNRSEKSLTQITNKQSTQSLTKQSNNLTPTYANNIKMKSITQNKSQLGDYPKINTHSANRMEQIRLKMK
jgi:hypothetical protein